jgi:hypothetical protein
MLDHGKVTQIPVPGNSGVTPTGAMQFQNDWPGLFIRGDDAMQLMAAICELKERLAGHPDLFIASALSRIARYADIIRRDVITRGDGSA